MKLLKQFETVTIFYFDNRAKCIFLNKLVRIFLDGECNDILLVNHKF